MSDETGDEMYRSLDESSWPGAPEGGLVGFEAIRDDLYSAVEGLGIAPGSPGEEGSAVSGCYLATWPVDRDGLEGIVVRWQLREQPDPGEPASRQDVESVDILNEALGPLLLALGFPIKPYAVDGGWIITRTSRLS